MIIIAGASLSEFKAIAAIIGRHALAKATKVGGSSSVR